MTQLTEVRDKTKSIDVKARLITDGVPPGEAQV